MTGAGAVIAAVYANALRAAFRTRASIPLLVMASLLCAGVSLLGFTADGTLTGKLRTATAYGLYVTSFFTMVLMLYLASTDLADEFRKRTLFLLDSKPAPRWAIMLGKWLAMATIAAGVLILVGGLLYASVRWRVHRFHAATESKIQRIESAYGAEARGTRGHQLMEERIEAIRAARDAEMEEARATFLIARAIRGPDLPSREALIANEMRKVEANPALASDARQMAMARQSIAAFVERFGIPIVPGSSHALEVRDVPRGDRPLTIRYRLNAKAGDYRPEFLSHAWRFSGSDTTTTDWMPHDSRRLQWEELRVPGSIVGSDGRLRIDLRNRTEYDPATDPPPVLAVPIQRGLEVWAPVGGFSANFARGLLLIYIRLLMIAAIGVAASTELRGSITAFLLLGVLTIGTLNDFVRNDELARGVRRSERGTDKDSAKQISYRIAARGFSYFLLLCPDFQQSDPSEALVNGRVIPWSRIGWQACWDLLVRSLLVLLLGAVVFHRRELAQSID